MSTNKPREVTQRIAFTSVNLPHGLSWARESYPNLFKEITDQSDCVIIEIPEEWRHTQIKEYLWLMGCIDE